MVLVDTLVAFVRIAQVILFAVLAVVIGLLAAIIVATVTIWKVEKR